MPKGNQKIIQAVEHMDRCAINLVEKARDARSRQIEWNGLVWQEQLFDCARRYARSVDKLTRVRKMAKAKRRGLNNVKVPA